MDTKKTIRKILFTTVWIVLGGGMFTLLLAAIGKKNKEQCSDYIINIKGKQDNFFVENKDVLQLLTAATKGNIKGQPMSAFNLHKLEELLEDNVWIKDAQLYFDNKDVLHITVTERDPIARIFTTAGNSYYIDNSSKRMPLSEKMSARVPVFTGFPEKTGDAKESALLNEVKKTAEFIMNDPFWMSQVAQIDITADKNFEMIPVVGNHTVKLGNGEDISKKFNRLFIFYKDVLSKTGFDKYASIDVQYAGQVVAIKGRTMTKVDSVQLRKNVEKLLLQAQQMQSDTTFTTNPVIEKPVIKEDSTTAPVTNLKTKKNKN
ncbi:MAG: cell division protein FtsQ/DivIB [Chitinophagales bacterium]